MNPWDLLWIILGWSAVVLVVLVVVTVVLIAVGVVVGLAKGGRTHNIMNSRKDRGKRHD